VLSELVIHAPAYHDGLKKNGVSCATPFALINSACLMGVKKPPKP